MVVHVMRGVELLQIGGLNASKGECHKVRIVPATAICAGVAKARLKAIVYV